MKRSAAPSTEDRLLGSLETNIAGEPYYEDRIACGEEARLEREPENRHDSNAIRIESPDHRPVGHLPRRIAEWLAPLVDAGKIRPFGRVPGDFARSTRFSSSTPLHVDLWITTKGRSILDPVTHPGSARAALHEMVRGAWAMADQAMEAHVVDDLALLLGPIESREILPETRMLLALLPDRARRAGTRAAAGVVDELRAFLKEVRIGPSIESGGLAVFPLFRGDDSRPPSTLLSKAIADGTAEVVEVSEAGEVPNVAVVNKGTGSVLIPEGEILVGAKQNRVVNLTILVAAGSRVRVPVTCVERGRWRKSSERFEPAFFSPPSLRGLNLENVNLSRRAGAGFRSDQGALWNAVAAELSARGVSSPTGDLTEALKEVRKKAERIREELRVPEGACGFLAGVDDAVLGMDLFDSPSTLEILWERLVESYVYAAACSVPAGRTTRETAEGFLRDVAAGAAPGGDSPGLGVSLEIKGEELVGHALWHEGTVRHLAAFRTEKRRRRHRAPVEPQMAY